ncbi:MAG: heme ABC exporter ATP-binding protein CcmA [Desulfovibrionaceae bacterium]
MLTCSKLAKFYGAKLVFKDVTLAIGPGEIVLVAGPNGAGKSTLLKIMAGLARPTRGTVQHAIGPEKIGYLGHQTFIYPDLTGLENLAFWARAYGLPATRDALLAALDRMELAHAAHERAGGYSRGMAQRLNLARVFLPEPSLVLLDEPGTGLDRRSGAIMHREIKAARARGGSLVWISHHVERDLCLADRVLALGGKRVEYLGPATGYVVEAPIC